MERYPYDLSHFGMSCTEIGRLSFLSAIHVLPSDTHEILVRGAIRLSPMIHQHTVDSQVDLYAFFVPDRHIYGSDIIDMMKLGIPGTGDTPVSLATVTVPIGAGEDSHYLPVPPQGSECPLRWPAGYANIWNWYFRVPTYNDESDLLDNTDFLAASGNDRTYGYPIARLPTMATTGARSSNLDADSHNTLSTAASDITLLDVAQVQATYRSKLDRDWFAQRYPEVMGKTFGAKGFNPDVDPDALRPSLIAHQKFWMSGYDIDATGTNIGEWKGKGIAPVEFYIPPKLFNEHGLLWILYSVRFPSIFDAERHYLVKNMNTYAAYAGDPNVINSQPPLEIDKNDIFRPTGSYSLGYMPYGQWWRTQPSFVHKKFQQVQGFPFINHEALGNSLDKFIYESPGDLDMFSDETYGHAQIYTRIDVESKRIVPPASNSIYAGATHVN